MLWRSLLRLVRTATDEPALSRYYSAFRTSRDAPAAFVAKRPLASLQALVAMIRLPSRTAWLTAGPGGEAIRRALRRRVLSGAPLGVTGVSVLDLPRSAGEYVQGRARQTLRRRVRSAESQGITYRAISDPAERRTLLELADEAEKSHPDPRYRISDPDNADLLQHDLWLGAFSAQGEPLLLSVTPTDGEWGLLRYFRTLGRGPQHSDSRYLMCVALVQALADRGVRHVVDTWHPGEIPEGLRQFQRSVGYRLVRVLPRRIRSAAPAGGPATAAPRADRRMLRLRPIDDRVPGIERDDRRCRSSAEGS
jgi:hypothetical protein